MQLSDYFKAGFFERALERYAAEPWGQIGLPWKPPLYVHTVQAFGTEQAGKEQFDHFLVIYSELRSYWGTHRNGQVWEAKKLFDVLKSDCRACSLRSGVTCLELTDREIQRNVVNCMQAIELVKPTKDESPMAMSKYLHFFNPMLFPIYDNEWVKKKVLKEFKSDWNQIHDPCSSPSQRVQTYLRYLMLAHKCMSSASDDIMQVFVQWLNRHSVNAVDGSEFPSELHRFYGAVFEFVAIGAALLESDWRNASRGRFDNYDENGVDLTLIDYMLTLTPVQRLLLMEQHADDTKILMEYGRKHREAQAAEGV